MGKIQGMHVPLQIGDERPPSIPTIDPRCETPQDMTPNLDSEYETFIEPEDYVAYVIHNLKSSGHAVELTYMHKEALEPLYDEAHTTKMHNVINVLEIASIFNIPNVAMTKIFRSISRDIIPQDKNSKMLVTYEEGQQLIKQLGLDYDIIDACPCDEFLYCGKNENTLISCPKCKLSRYKSNIVSKKVPRKVRLSLS